MATSTTEVTSAARRSSVAERDSAPPAADSAPDPFASFVVGPGNALAHEAAQRIVSGDPGRLNPFVIVGPSGVGKTHLVQSVRRSLGRSVVYRSSEEFTSEVTQAIRTREMPSVRHRYRTAANVLILEDIHFLEGRRATQVELFHTLDHLLARGRPVVLTADRSPQELRGLDASLRSRLCQGLVAFMRPPDHETRLRILRERAAGGGVRVPEACLERLAQRSVRSVRDLVAGLNQAVARSSLLRRPLTLELVEEALQAVDIPGRSCPLDELIELVVSAYGVSLDDLRGRSRKQAIVRPRQLAMYLCRRYSDASLKEIGRRFERDHTSVLYSIAAVEKRIAERPQLRYELEALVARIAPAARS